MAVSAELPTANLGFSSTLSEFVLKQPDLELDLPHYATSGLNHSPQVVNAVV